MRHTYQDTEPTRPHVLPDDFDDRRFRPSKETPCPICGKPDWCLSDRETWALCQRTESKDRYGKAGWLHLLNGAGAHRDNGAIHVPQSLKDAMGTTTKPPSESKKVWGDDLEKARAIFEALPLAREDAEAVAYLEKAYGIPAQVIPNAWRVCTYPDLGKGIAYEGRDTAGPVASFKFKSFKRNAKGKREYRFLFGTGGYCSMQAQGGKSAGLVIVGGEEKALAASMAGFNAISPLMGESCIDDELVAWLCENPATVILCNDNDDKGRTANEESAQALLRAGFPGEDLHIIAWPEGFPEKGDINDVLKQFGIDGLRALLESAPAQVVLPRCLSAADFLAAPREPLAFHIDGILPEGGKLTFSATSKWGKSMWAIQTGLALAAGDCEWLGWKFGKPAKVLYLQAEIMDSLLASRLQWILQSMPPGIDQVRASRNFIVQEIAGQRPNLLDPRGRTIAEKLIARHEPDVLMLDPLAAICPGMEENEAKSMGAVLDYFSNLTVRFGCAVVLVHHHGKTGVSRGSSVFEAWPESDLAASFLDESREVAKIEMRLRCTYNKGAVYWRMPTPDLPWFESMGEGWQPEPKTRARKATANHAVLALKASGQKMMSWKELRDAIQEITDCGQKTAQNVITEAKDQGLIRYENALYFLPA